MAAASSPLTDVAATCAKVITLLGQMIMQNNPRNRGKPPFPVLLFVLFRGRFSTNEGLPEDKAMRCLGILAILCSLAASHPVWPAARKPCARLDGMHVAFSTDGIHW